MVATVSQEQRMAYVDVQYGRFITGTHPETTQDSPRTNEDE
jgi:hypothetical protein